MKDGSAEYIRDAIERLQGGALTVEIPTARGLLRVCVDEMAHRPNGGQMLVTPPAGQPTTVPIADFARLAMVLSGELDVLGGPVSMVEACKRRAAEVVAKLRAGMTECSIATPGGPVVAVSNDGIVTISGPSTMTVEHHLDRRGLVVSLAGAIEDHGGPLDAPGSTISRARAEAARVIADLRRGTPSIALVTPKGMLVVEGPGAGEGLRLRPPENTGMTDVDGLGWAECEALLADVLAACGWAGCSAGPEPWVVGSRRGTGIGPIWYWWLCADKDDDTEHIEYAGVWPRDEALELAEARGVEAVPLASIFKDAPEGTAGHVLAKLIRG